MKSRLFLCTLLLVFALTSCGVSSSFVANVSNITTSVELSQKNFKILNKVEGISSNTYIFGVGGLSNTALVEKAKNKMMNKADLIGGSKMVINITYDTHNTFIVPFFYKKTVTASGYVIEFTE